MRVAIATGLVAALTVGAAIAQPAPPDVAPVGKADEVNGQERVQTTTPRKKPGKRPTIRNGQVVMDEILAAEVKAWPEASRRAVVVMFAKYGDATEHSESLVIWRDVGPWKKIVVHREGIEHQFPVPHQDILEQVIAYDVPADKFDDLAMFDGSLTAKRTTGTLSSSCETEGGNLLALNLAHEVITDKKSVDDARAELARVAEEQRRGKKDVRSQKLQFEPEATTGDVDQVAPKLTAR